MFIGYYPYFVLGTNINHSIAFSAGRIYCRMNWYISLRTTFFPLTWLYTGFFPSFRQFFSRTELAPSRVFSIKWDADCLRSFPYISLGKNWNPSLEPIFPQLRDSWIVTCHTRPQSAHVLDSISKLRPSYVFLTTNLWQIASVAINENARLRK